MATLFKAVGKAENVTPQNAGGFTLEEVTRYVGGKIETHVIGAADERLDGLRTLFVNKYAHYLGKPANTDATEFARALGYLRDGEQIAGDALLVRNDEINF